MTREVLNRIASRSLLLGAVVTVMSVLVDGYAYAGLGVSPSKIVFQSMAGEKCQRQVKVYNTSEHSLRINCENLDFSIDKNGEPNNVGISGGELACSSWLHVDPESFVLNAGSSRDVRIRTVLPEKVNGRGHAAYIRIKAAPIANAGISANQVIDALVIFDIRDADHKVSKSPVSLAVDMALTETAMPWLGAALPIEIAARNSSDVIVPFSGELTLTHRGDIVTRIPISGRTVFPHSTRKFSQKIDFPDETGWLDLKYSGPMQTDSQKKSGKIKLLSVSKKHQRLIVVLAGSIAALLFAYPGIRHINERMHNAKSA